MMLNDQRKHENDEKQQQPMGKHSNITITAQPEKNNCSKSDDLQAATQLR
jgi:hypothetical protein